MPRPVAALTGATGFLGGRLALALADAGFEVRVLARRDLSGQPWAGRVHQVVRGALEDAPALERLVEDVQVVVHAAGVIKARSRAEFIRANAEGARQLARAAAARAPDARFLLVSSLSAREPHLSDYAASKAAGEAAVRETLNPERLTVVRPPAIYGPGDRETLALFRAAQRLPFLPLPGAEHARLAVVHVEDAAAQVAALAAGPGPGGVFALADVRPEGYGWRELMQAAAQAVGRPKVRLVPLPPAAVIGVGAMVSGIGRLGGPVPILTPGKAREMLHPDWSVAVHELPPQVVPPRFGLEAGFSDAVAWYRIQGWL